MVPASCKRVRNSPVAFPHWVGHPGFESVYFCSSGHNFKRILLRYFLKLQLNLTNNSSNILVKINSDSTLHMQMRLDNLQLCVSAVSRAACRAAALGKLERRWAAREGGTAPKSTRKSVPPLPLISNKEKSPFILPFLCRDTSCISFSCAHSNRSTEIGGGSCQGCCCFLLCHFVVQFTVG